MEWDFIFIVKSILLGMGLAMDAFSVSLANGLSEPFMKRSKMALIAFVFALFQAIMPLIGWLCVHTIADKFEAFRKFIPWIALVLLLYIGGSMLVEGMKRENKAEVIVGKLGLGALIIQGIATSIDALSVGFTIATYNFTEALAAAIIIALVTFVICVAGVKMGKCCGTRFSKHSSILGGIILIIIGIEIFVTGII